MDASRRPGLDRGAHNRQASGNPGHRSLSQGIVQYGSDGYVFYEIGGGSSQLASAYYAQAATKLEKKLGVAAAASPT